MAKSITVQKNIYKNRKRTNPKTGKKETYKVKVGSKTIMSNAAKGSNRGLTNNQSRLKLAELQERTKQKTAKDMAAASKSIAWADAVKSALGGSYVKYDSSPTTQLVDGGASPAKPGRDEDDDESMLGV